MRSFLTMLGIIIGIASIIAIVSTIKGTNEEIKNQLIGSGSNTVEILIKKNSYELYISSSSDIPYGIPEVSDSVREQILALDTVENVTCYTERESADSVYYQNTDFSYPTIRGIDAGYFDTVGYQIRSGRGFVESDYTDFHKVVILDSILADNYFPNESAVGKTIEIKGVPFTVVGVVADSGSYDASINTISDYYTYMDTSAGCMFAFMLADCILLRRAGKGHREGDGYGLYGKGGDRGGSYFEFYDLRFSE